ncbi:(2Fe-2S)-binding protein [Saccharicrinis sp. FJH62]|uniref:(2Fe-2S)-binding protein n=1 Tax=Saccharicrinis sp. FJH62 TaxID=3344657 RepID=UPI0035D48989
MICTCNRVSGADVKRALKKHPDASVEDIRLMTGASISCGKCYRSLVQFIEMNRTVKYVQNNLFKNENFG